MKFSKGDRIKFSKEGLDVLRPRYPDRLGTVIGFSHSPNCCSVRWDETSLKSRDCLHVRFLELMPQLIWTQ